MEKTIMNTTLKKLKKDFMDEAKIIEREGIVDLLNYLEEGDFFTAPASTMYHDSEEGGLVLHSLSVYDVAKELNSLFTLEYNAETIAICALFHDVCKMNMYVKATRNKKINGQWQEILVWEVQDQLPLGHGEKSIYMINKFMELTEEEAMAIRWHLGGFDTAVHFPYPYGFPQKQAFRESKLVTLLAIADLSASYILK
jgi:hypothetical protein